MAVLIPIFILLLAIAALAGASRLQQGFRSHWMISAGGALLAGVYLLILLFRLPVTSTFPGWAISAQIQFPITLSITTFTWPLGFAVIILLLLGLLAQMRQPPNLDWRAWAPGLLLAAAGLLVSFSGDMLALAISFFLLDLLSIAFHVVFSSDPQLRSSALLLFTVNLVSVVILLAARGLLDSWPWLCQDLILPVVVLRVGLLTPRLVQFPAIQRRELDLLLRFTGPVTALSALALWQPVASMPPVASWVLLLFLGVLIFTIHGPARLLPRFVTRLRIPSRPDRKAVIPFFANGLRWSLDLLAKILEGEAGLLWALLFVALFLSLASQFGAAIR